MLIVGLPRPQNTTLLDKIINHYLVDSFRFNTGVRVPSSPSETLKLFLDKVSPDKFWLDIKGRQLRITKWTDSSHEEITLNHKIEVDLPATIHFRGDQSREIIAIDDNKIYIDQAPKYALGAGQSVNIHGDNLKIKGYLTKEDIAYLQAARKLGIKNLMLSFVEKNQDIIQVKKYIPKANLCLKIESPKGLNFIKNSTRKNLHLMAARDDLFVNLESPFEIFSALKLIIEKDPQAIVASRILTSLIKGSLSMSDINDLFLLDQLGYKNFMLSDSMTHNVENFSLAMHYWKQFEVRKGTL